MAMGGKQPTELAMEMEQLAMAIGWHSVVGVEAHNQEAVSMAPAYVGVEV